MACDRCNCYFSFQAIFCPFTPLTAQETKISKQLKKILDISSFYTILPKIMIICHTFPEIYVVWQMQLLFFILGYFLPFYRPNSPKNENFKKMKKKTPGGIITLQKCTKNHDHMLYCSWDKWCVTDVIVIFHFGLFFARLPPEQLKKTKKKQKPVDIISNMCTKNYD